MAKVHIERAYIEPHDKQHDQFAILIHIKEENDHIYAGKVEIDQPVKWLYTDTNENGDLEINYSAGMENSKWDYLTREIIGDINVISEE